MNKTELYNIPIEIYFYNGYNPPKRLGGSLAEFVEKGVTIESTYHWGLVTYDITGEIIERLKLYLTGDIFGEEIGGDIFVDPTYNDFIIANKFKDLRDNANLEGLELKGDEENGEEKEISYDDLGYPLNVYGRLGHWRQPLETNSRRYRQNR